MPKIIAKADLVQNSNLFLHIADKGGTDIAIAEAGGILTITTTLGAFATTGASDANGVINRAIAIDDVIKISHTGEAVNEGVTAVVTAVSDIEITATTLTGSPIAESAGLDINIVAFKKTYQFTEVGAMSFIDGCQGIVLKSKLVDMWDLFDLDKYLTPFTSIEPRAKSLASLYGWEPHDLDTLNAIRDTALEIRDAPTSSARKIYFLFSSDDTHAPTDQFTVWASSDPEMTAPALAVMTGSINQLFLAYDLDGADNRASNGVTWFARCMMPLKTPLMQQFSIDYAEIITVGVGNLIDPKLEASDGTIGAGGIYANIIFDSDLDGIYEGDVDGNINDYDGHIVGDSQTNQTVHEKINYLWRQPDDINFSSTNNGTGTADGATMRGDKQFPITSFSGEVFTLLTYLLGFDASTRNNLIFVDTLGNPISYPSILTLGVASALLAHGGDFTVWHTSTYGTNDATIFEDESGTPQQDITIAELVNIVMAYSTYAVGGHTAGTPLGITITYNKPNFIEPDSVTATLDGSNNTATLVLTADSSYIV